MPPRQPARTPSGLHQSAATGYAAAADTYRSGRPDYPAAVADWLHDIVGIDAASTVLEVGAGTGAFTPFLIATRARVCALEPVHAMRAILRRRAPQAMAVGAAAQALPVRASTVHAVACAQSFHWFASTEVVQEFARVLVPHGVLALIWNVRDERVPWVRRLSTLTDEFEGEAPRYKSGAWERALDDGPLVEIDRREVPHTHVGPVEQVVIHRTLSVSFIAALPEEERTALTGRLRQLVRQEPALAREGDVAFPYRTVMRAYRNRP